MNPYQVLEIESGATPDEIKSAYRKLAMKHHPDRNGGTDEAAKKFQEIQSAYDMLRNDKPQNQQQDFEFDHSNIHEMFRNFFHQQQMGNPTLQAHCEISLDQAYTGCAITFNVNGTDLTVDVPAGVDQSQIIRIAGGAGQPNSNFPAGDLHVIVRIRQHPVFRRHGLTLIRQMKIDLLDLVTGCEMETITIDGTKKTFTVPPNSNPETVVVIEKSGMPVMNSTQYGDLMVHFDIMYPTFTDEQLETLRTMKS